MANTESMSSTTIHTSPSFSRDSSNNIADIADRVVQELRIAIGFGDDNDVFSFSDDDEYPAEIGGDDEENDCNRTEVVEQKAEEVLDENEGEGEGEGEFEFPVVFRGYDHEHEHDHDQISLRYPVFDRTLLSELDLNSGVDFPEIDPKTRPSLKKLFSEDRDAASASASASTSPSSSEADELDGIPPGTYCVWKPKPKPKPKTESTRGKHKKSKSISIGNASKKWKVRDLLKRSYSDDSYTAGKDSPVILFIPPISQKRNNEKVSKVEKTGKVGSAIGVASPEKKIPAYKSKVGNIRLPPYLPYRDDQLAAFANFAGSSKNLYRY